MKKILLTAIAAAMCIFTVSCGKETETVQPTSTVTENVVSAAESPSLDSSYLAGTWKWQEEKSPDSISKMRSFKLNADGTGKILSFDGDKPETSLTWVIEDHGSWSSVHLFSSDNSWNCNYELDSEYLKDLTGSDYFVKK